VASQAKCPACEDRVAVPPGTRANSQVRCPSCDQLFVPPWLRVTVVEDEDDEPYDPKTAEAYTVQKARGKKVRAKVTAKSQVEEDDENWKPRQSGPEWILLFLGIGLGVVIPAAFLLGKWALTKNVGVVVPLVCACFVVIGLWFVGAYLNLFRIRGFLNRLFGPW
jgi:hypothetical protein